MAKSELIDVCRPHGIVSAYRNDLRQLHVNHVADHIGSGIGTGRFYGVPGTGGNYGYYGYGGYGHPHWRGSPVQTVSPSTREKRNQRG